MARGAFGALRVAVCSVVITLLSGCVAAALAPVVPLVGGMMGGKSQVVIDESTVDPQLKELLPSTRRLAFISQEPTAMHAAEHMELNSDYQVSLVAPPHALSPSQARQHMETVCTGPEKPDVVLNFRSPQSDAGTGTTTRGVLTGRVKYDLDLTTDVLVCDTGWRTQFLTTGQINQGMYNADQSKLPQILGQEFSLALLRLAGRTLPDDG